MSLVMLAGTCFWYDVFLFSRQCSLLDGQGLESAYLQYDCFGSATADKMTHQRLNLLNNCDWMCLAHTLVLHEVDVHWDLCGCSFGALESSSDSIILKSGHMCYILCIDTSLQEIGIPVHEWIYYSDLASYVFFYFCKVSLPGLSLDFEESCMVLAYQLVFSSYCVCLWKALFLWCLIKLIWVACGSPATCLIWCAVAFECSNLFASCWTLLAGNLSRSTLPSVIVLETKSSLHKKNKNVLM